MFRRCLSLLVIAGLLASQLAVIPHVHGSATPEEQQKHNATPHIHCAWLGHSGHDHSHSGKGHSHPGSHHDEGAKPATDDSDGHPLAIGLSGADHDTDAIFVSDQAATASRQVSAWQPAALAPLFTGINDLRSRQSPSPRWHPPDEVLDASDTYLTLRNLRI